MEKILEVKEYDQITCNERYRNSSKYKFLEKKFYQELRAYIENVTRNSDSYVNQAFGKKFSGSREEEGKPFMLIHQESGVGEVIEARNFVGLIQLESGMKIQILPKIEFGTGADETREVLLKMLKEMKNFSGWKLSAAKLASGSTNLYDIFIDMYLQEAKLLVKRGLRSDYEKVEGNLKSYKGKLLVSRQLRENLVHQERFYVKYQKFTRNRAENRLIKTTLLRLKKAASREKQIQEIRNLLPVFKRFRYPLIYGMILKK